jgi:hypothetical protein
MVAPPVGNILNNNSFAPLADNKDPAIDDSGVPLEIRNLHQSFVDMDVSRPRTLRSGREIGTLTSSALLNDLSMFTVVHWDYIFHDFALLQLTLQLWICCNIVIILNYLQLTMKLGTICANSNTSSDRNQ